MLSQLENYTSNIRISPEKNAYQLTSNSYLNHISLTNEEDSQKIHYLS